ncbi:MAG: hypothetical protein IID36_03955, partial [Planctomycetes bacterium]|nr:hypothetical protein [Planctomycetota bacterium]
MGEQQVKLMKVVLLVSSLASLSLLVYAAYEENFRGEWRSRQQTYGVLLASASPDGDAPTFPVEHKQIYLPELGLIDRCTTCHLGVENPAMASAEAPLTRHPGDLLVNHPPDKFGCTICH